MSTYSIIRGQPIREIGAMDLPCPKKEVLIPKYPHRRETLLGLEAFQGEAAKKVSDAIISNLFPIRYNCMLTTVQTGMLVEASIITHCELETWCDWHGYTLVSMVCNPELAGENERTRIG